MEHIICTYCGNLVLHNQYKNHVCNLPIFDYDNYDDIRNNIKCCMCDDKNINNFTKTQIRKIGLARCINCVKNNITYKSHKYLNLLPHDTYHTTGMNLYTAVCNCNILKIKQLLENGADPNYTRLKTLWNGFQWVQSYTQHKEPVQDDSDHCIQPTQPLTAVVFRISDCLLSKHELNIYNEIAQLLIAYGANKYYAIEMIKHRYNIYHKCAVTDPFNNVINTILE